MNVIGFADPHVARLARLRPRTAPRARTRRRASRERVDKPEARVVPRARVLAARIAEAGDEPDRSRHRYRTSKNEKPADSRVAGPCCRLSEQRRRLFLLLVLARSFLPPFSSGFASAAGASAPAHGAARPRLRLPLPLPRSRRRPSARPPSRRPDHRAMRDDRHAGRQLDAGHVQRVRRVELPTGRPR